MATVPKEFADDFKVACRYWQATGETDEGIEDIRNAARTAHGLSQDIPLWSDWIKGIAAHQRAAETMSAGGAEHAN